MRLLVTRSTSTLTWALSKGTQSLEGDTTWPTVDSRCNEAAHMSQRCDTMCCVERDFVLSVALLTHFACFARFI